MLYGLPLILSDIEPHREILEEGKGWLVPQDKPEFMAKKILFFKENVDDMKSFGLYNRKIAEKKYDIRHYVKEVEKNFESLT